MQEMKHLPIELSVDSAAGIGEIHQRVGDRVDDVITVTITRDQAIQIADFLIKSFKVKKSETVQGDPAGFDEFWKAYPRKESKQASLSIWKRDNCAVIAEKIMSDVARRKDSQQWIDGYIPHPNTYLRQKRYDDDPTEVVAAQPWDGVL
jgi:hypothetical protein